MSSIIRFISDTHFGHENLARLRGFKSSDEHDNYIIDKWNFTVKKGDVTWILGDITMEKRNYSILDKLKGYKRVVLGNHDIGNHSITMLNYVNSVHGMVKYKHKDYGSIWLTHSPVYPQELEYRVSFNIHGHIHKGYIIEDRRYINVCAEVINYTPKTIDELIYNTL